MLVFIHFSLVHTSRWWTNFLLAFPNRYTQGTQQVHTGMVEGRACQDSTMWQVVLID